MKKGPEGSPPPGNTPETQDSGVMRALLKGRVGKAARWLALAGLVASASPALADDNAGATEKNLQAARTPDDLKPQRVAVPREEAFAEFLKKDPSSADIAAAMMDDLGIKGGFAKAAFYARLSFNGYRDHPLYGPYWDKKNEENPKPEAGAGGGGDGKGSGGGGGGGSSNGGRR